MWGGGREEEVEGWVVGMLGWVGELLEEVVECVGGRWGEIVVREEREWGGSE